MYKRISFSVLVCFILFTQSFIHTSDKDTPANAYCNSLSCWQTTLDSKKCLQHSNISKNYWLLIQKTIAENPTQFKNTHPLDIPVEINEENIITIRALRRLIGATCDYGHWIPGKIRFLMGATCDSTEGDDPIKGYDCVQCKQNT